MKPQKIISGGQTGADMGGLIAAKATGIPTGGYAPHNWQTEEGPKEELLRAFNLEPAPPDTKIYKLRTRLNIKHSDATVWFGDTTSPGGKTTINYARKIEKPICVNPTHSDLLEFLNRVKPQVLNIAGNRESKNPGICEHVVQVLVGVFSSHAN